MEKSYELTNMIWYDPIAEQIQTDLYHIRCQK